MAYVRSGLGKSYEYKSIKKDFNSIPWDELYRVYRDAANDWEEVATALHKDNEDKAYEAYISRQQFRVQDSEEGAYEGNFSDSNPQKPYSPLANRVEGRRRAGQKAVVDNFIKNYNLGDWSESVMPQIITKLGNMKITKKNGLISGQAFVKDNFITDSDKGLYVFLMLNSRSSYLTTQYKGSARPYSSLVPLILYAIRLVRGEVYTAWDREELHFVVNSELCDAMLFTTDNWPTREELLEGRTAGLTVASGKDAGKLRSAVSTYKLYAVAGTCYQGLPALVQVMLSQIWVAHPDNRTKYMILDPMNWDKVPQPLVPTEVFAEYDPKLQEPQQDRYLSDLPWNI